MSHRLIIKLILYVTSCDLNNSRVFYVISLRFFGLPITFINLINNIFYSIILRYSEAPTGMVLALLHSHISIMMMGTDCTQVPCSSDDTYTTWQAVAYSRCLTCEWWDRGNIVCCSWWRTLFGRILQPEIEKPPNRLAAMRVGSTCDNCGGVPFCTIHTWVFTSFANTKW